jgi:ankyrin repeat protein
MCLLVRPAYQQERATVVDRAGRSPLHYAALDNDVELARSALADGVDPNGADRDGFRPLHFAAQQGAAEVARLLLDAGADVDPANAYGNTPLFVAVFNSRGDGSLIGLLRARGANPFAANRHGQTPIGLSRLIANYPVAQSFADLE